LAQHLPQQPAPDGAVALRGIVPPPALGLHLDQFQRIVVDPASVTVIRYTPGRPFVVRLNDSGAALATLKPPPRPRRRRSRAADSDASVGGGAGSDGSHSARRRAGG